jgi:ABC-type cobalt transport system substrate-binding protein
VVVTGSSASHHYNIIGDRILCIGVLHAAETNFDSRAHYIGADGGAHCTLIEEIAPDQGMGGGFDPLWPNPLEINSNIQLNKSTGNVCINAW